MNNSPRMKLLTLCIGAALAQMASLPTLADSAVGVDTVNGNAANPGYASSGPVLLDEDAPAVLRTPSGQMYSFPPAKDVVGKGQAVGSIDVGVTRDSDQTRNAKRNEYTDIQKNGVVVNNFKLGADSDAARYFNINGGAVGRGDQYYDLTVGKYNSWKVKSFYNETQHIFTENWKSLYSGEGTGELTTGLNMPVRVTSGAMVQGTTPNYVGATATCTTLAPCWSYNGKIYGNAVALAAINGTTGTPNATTGVITAGTIAAPGAQSNMAAAIAAKLNATPYSELGLVRKKSGMRGDINLTDSVKAYVSYNLEKRVGARPFAMNDGNVSTEIAEPINYNTHDILAGLSYSDDLTQANLRASSSMFRNSISTLNVQYALLGVAGSNGVIQHATYDLAPDNDSYNLKGEFARSLPDLMKGRFTASASLGSNRQNEALLAPISAAQNADLSAAGVTTLTAPTTATSLGVANPGYTANGALVNNWNTTDALSRKNAGQRIDNKLVEFALSLKPVDDLNVKGSYRFFETENKGGYIAYNPLTGQFGRGPSTGNGTAALDLVVGLQPGATPGAPGSCYTLPGYPAAPNCAFGTGAANLTAGTFPNGANTVTSGTNVPVFGQARTTRQSNYGVAADYDLDRTSSVNGSIEREDFYRTFRERNKTEENKVKVGYVNRALGDATLRVSYEKDTKRGSNYNYRTFEDLGQGLPGLEVGTLVSQAPTGAVPGVAYPLLVAGVFNRYSYYFRKYDQANRDQKILNTRINYQATTDWDVGLNMQVKRADYPEGMYGLKKDNQDSLGVDMSYQPTFDRIVTAYYNYQKGQKVMMMNSGTAGAATACTAANLNTYGIPACSDTTTGLDGARPYSASWASDTTDYNNVLGLGLQEDLGFARLGFDYTFARSSTHIAYNYGNTAFSATTNAALAAIAGTALPDMTTVQNTVTLNLVKPLDKKTTVRAVYRYDGLRIKDWHYDGVIKNTMAAYDAGTLLLDGGPMNYHVNTIGVFLNYKL